MLSLAIAKMLPVMKDVPRSVPRSFEAEVQIAARERELASSEFVPQLECRFQPSLPCPSLLCRLAIFSDAIFR